MNIIAVFICSLNTDKTNAVCFHLAWIFKSVSHHKCLHAWIESVTVASLGTKNFAPVLNLIFVTKVAYTTEDFSLHLYAKI